MALRSNSCGCQGGVTGCKVCSAPFFLLVFCSFVFVFFVFSRKSFKLLSLARGSIQFREFDPSPSARATSPSPPTTPNLPLCPRLSQHQPSPQHSPTLSCRLNHHVHIPNPVLLEGGNRPRPHLPKPTRDRLRCPCSRHSTRHRFPFDALQP